MFKKLRGTLVMLWECVRMSLANIFGNRMRSFLTVLGILIGVAAVIALITTVNGFSGSLTSSFMSMGAGSLTVTVTGSDLKSGLTSTDLEALAELPEVAGVSPSVSLRARISRGGAYDTGVFVAGRNAYYFRENDDLLKRGRHVNPLDERDTTYVCMIDQERVETFFFGIDLLRLQSGDQFCIFKTNFSMQGIQYGRLRAQGLSSKDFVVLATAEGLNVAADGRLFALDDGGALIPIEG